MSAPTHPLDGRPVLCRLDELPDPGAKSVVLGTGADALDVIVLRQGAGAVAYLNSCPHQGTPLETFPGRFLDEQGDHLVCSTHGARFRLRDGRCVAGPCKGASLVPLEIALEKGVIVLAGRPSRQHALDGS